MSHSLASETSESLVYVPKAWQVCLPPCTPLLRAPLLSGQMPEPVQALGCDEIPLMLLRGLIPLLSPRLVGRTVSG